MGQPSTVDSYLASFPASTQEVLVELRQRIRTATPDAEEKISYGIPTYTVGGRRVVHFAGWQRHVSIYPIPATDADLRDELAPYVSGAGTLKFPLSSPMPWDLVDRVIAAFSQPS